MKKISMLLLMVITFLLTGCGNADNSLTKISFDDLNQKIESKESFIIYFDNGDNTKLQNKLEKVLTTNNLDGYYIDTTKINDSDKIKLQTTIYYETPSIVFIIEGKDPSKLSHVTNSDITTKELTARLKDLKFIK